MQRMKALAVSGALIVAGCGSGGSEQLDTIPPTSATVGPLPTLPESSVVTTTAPPVTLPNGVVGLSADGPWTLVDSAPGVTTPGLVYELMPGLWVYLPVVEDVPNGVTWTLNEEDRPIIEGYLRASLVYYAAVTSIPMNFSSAGWNEFYVDGGARLKGVMEPRGTAGQVVSLDAGVVLRPTVRGDGRTDVDAVVLDCEINGAVRRNADGSLAEGSTPGIGVNEVGVTMRFVAGAWKQDRIADAEGACS
ncbi:MAG: hypothetical protein ABL953_05175 [Ilumatobacteraceae bacterium]